ncbi:MAG: hypothetical protein V7776_04890 [Halopseudomonas aestusnigri]
MDLNLFTKTVDVILAALSTYEVIKDLAFLIIACSGLYVAWAGLSAWKTKLSGESGHVLSMKLLVHLTKYNNAIRYMRHPPLFIVDAPLPSEVRVNVTNILKDDYNSWAKFYNSQRIVIQDHKQNLYNLLIEASILWEDDLLPPFYDIIKLNDELNQSIERNLRVASPDTQPEQEVVDILNIRKSREIIFGRADDCEDVFRDEIQECVDKISKKLNKKLIKYKAPQT